MADTAKDRLRITFEVNEMLMNPQAWNYGDSYGYLDGTSLRPLEYKGVEMKAISSTNKKR